MPNKGMHLVSGNDSVLPDDAGSMPHDEHIRAACALAVERELRRIGFDEQMRHDLHEMREFLADLREARRAIVRTIATGLVLFIVVAFTLGIKPWLLRQ